jgi:hypothetical protein
VALTLAKNEMDGSESREMCFVMYDSHVDVDVLFFYMKVLAMDSMQLAPRGVPRR